MLDPKGFHHLYVVPQTSNWVLNVRAFGGYFKSSYAIMHTAARKAL